MDALERLQESYLQRLESDLASLRSSARRHRANAAWKDRRAVIHCHSHLSPC